MRRQCLEESASDGLNVLLPLSSVINAFVTKTCHAVLALTASGVPSSLCPARIAATNGNGGAAE